MGPLSPGTGEILHPGKHRSDAAMPLTYIVYAPSFDADNGGAIFMHELVHALNGLGERAFLWPVRNIFRPSIRSQVKRVLTGRLTRQPYATSSALNTPVARKSDLSPRAVVVYPEIVMGNPLRASNVVRWLLYKPGMLHPYRFGHHEMFFRAAEMCDLPEVTGGSPDLYLWKVNPLYRNEGRPDRKGACYIVRKGRAKPRIPETEGAIQVDGRSHEEIAAIFNSCETFYSYDEATMYSQFAALCGCLSIVVPGDFAASREDWVARHPIARFGVAYGTDPAELEHARATRDLLLEDLRCREAASLDTVRRFVDLTRARFAA
jgi:hypothetical protein